MATKPTDGHIGWISDDDTDKYIAPSAGKRLQGWLQQEKPPFQYFNWAWRLIDRWLKYFEQAVDENITAIELNTTHRGAASAVHGYAASGGQIDAVANIADKRLIAHGSIGSIDSNSTVLATVNLGSVVSGSLFLIYADITGYKGTLPGLVHFELWKSASTAVVYFGGYNETQAQTIGDTRHVEANAPIRTHLMGIGYVQSSGTYSVELIGMCFDGDAAIAPGGIGLPSITVVWLEKRAS